MKRIIDRMKFENELRELINEKYAKTSREELIFEEIMEAFEESEE